jgi:hypothetical protein
MVLSGNGFRMQSHSFAMLSRCSAMIGQVNDRKETDRSKPEVFTLAPHALKIRDSRHAEPELARNPALHSVKR